VICPPHDYNNGLEEFGSEKPLLDQGIDYESNSELVCGNISAPCKFEASLAVAPEDRREFSRSTAGFW